jgi:hypothetical protein
LIDDVIERHGRGRPVHRSPSRSRCRECPRLVRMGQGAASSGAPASVDSRPAGTCSRGEPDRSPAVARARRGCRRTAMGTARPRRRWRERAVADRSHTRRSGPRSGGSCPTGRRRSRPPAGPGRLRPGWSCDVAGARRARRHRRQRSGRPRTTGSSPPAPGHRLVRRHAPRIVPAPPRRERLRQPGRDLLIVIISEQGQGHHEIHHDVRRELPIRPLRLPARCGHRVIDRIPRHPGGQHPQRDLVRQTATSSHHASLRHKP